jgi:hypothetical protein
MTRQCRQAPFKADKNVHIEHPLDMVDLQGSTRLKTVRHRHRKGRFVKGVSTLAATIVIATLSTSAIAQEQQRAYSEYTYWFGGSFENGHAFSSTIGASTGRRAYSYGVGGSPIGAQVNFVHYRHVEPFLTSGGGFLYFNHRMFGTTQQFNFTAQLGGGVQLFTSSRRTAIDLGYKYHHISNANLGNQNPGLDSHMLFVGVSLFR